MTSDQRTTANQSGPYELLAEIRRFIDELLTDTEKSTIINTNTEPQQLPQAIAIGYFILKRIVTEMGGLQ